MKNGIAELLVRADSSVQDAIAAIDRGNKQIALVSDEAGRLLATVTDGDVRRGLLRGVRLDSPVSEIMHRDPTTIRADEDPDAAAALMRQRELRHVPVVDKNGRVVDLILFDDLTGLKARETRVVLMAGGLGKRLRPLTQTVPKPMLKLGDKPILQHIVESFREQGFRHFSISVNYRKEFVQKHFGDGSRFGVAIDYIVETDQLGTAGSLSLIGDRPTDPFIVMNGDILTSVRFDALLRFHAEQGRDATMCVRDFTLQVPYGVVQTDGTRFAGLVEKPEHNSLVNAGIYVLSPQVLDLLHKGKPLHMPDLFAQIEASVFPLREYWLDIGQMKDLERARAEVPSVLGS